MGFRSTFTTSDYHIQWPDWFVDKYADMLWFCKNNIGPLHPIHEAKADLQFGELHTDIQLAINWEGQRKGFKFILVYLHECGGISRCQIEQDKIRWTEPVTWGMTNGVNHCYCYRCSDAELCEPGNTLPYYCL